MASKRRLRRRSCEHKRRYATETLAAIVATAVRNETGSPTHWYQCPRCGGWHVGRRSRRLRQSIRARREHAEVQR